MSLWQVVIIMVTIIMLSTISGGFFVVAWTRWKVKPPVPTEIRYRRSFRALGMIQNVLHDFDKEVKQVRVSLDKLSKITADANNATEQRRAIQDQIENEITRLAHLTEEARFFLDAFHSDAKIRLRTSMIDIAELCEKVRKSRDELAKQNEVELWVDTPDDHPKAAVDKDRIERVLINLVENGIKYADHDKESCFVGIKVETKKDKIILTISDNGIGMPSECANSILEESLIARDERSGCIKGSGLGLAIVKTFVEAHNNANVSLKSIPNRETRIAIELPLQM